MTGEITEKCSALSFHDSSLFTLTTFCSSCFVASHPSPFLPSTLLLHVHLCHPSASISLLSTLFFSHALSILHCPLPSAGDTADTIALFCLDFITTNLSILFQVVPLSFTLLLYLCPPAPDWIIIIPRMDFCSDNSAFRMNI